MIALGIFTPFTHRQGGWHVSTYSRHFLPKFPIISQISDPRIIKISDIGTKKIGFCLIEMVLQLFGVKLSPIQKPHGHLCHLSFTKHSNPVPIPRFSPGDSASPGFKLESNANVTKFWEPFFFNLELSTRTWTLGLVRSWTGGCVSVRLELSAQFMSKANFQTG